MSGHKLGRSYRWPRLKNAAFYATKEIILTRPVDKLNDPFRLL